MFNSKLDTLMIYRSDSLKIILLELIVSKIMIKTLQYVLEDGQIQNVVLGEIKLNLKQKILIKFVTINGKNILFILIIMLFNYLEKG